MISAEIPLPSSAMHSAFCPRKLTRGYPARMAIRHEWLSARMAIRREWFHAHRSALGLPYLDLLGSTAKFVCMKYRGMQEAQNNLGDTYIFLLS